MVSVGSKDSKRRRLRSRMTSYVHKWLSSICLIYKLLTNKLRKLLFTKSGAVVNFWPSACSAKFRVLNIFCTMGSSKNDIETWIASTKDSDGIDFDESDLQQDARSNWPAFMQEMRRTFLSGKTKLRTCFITERLLPLLKKSGGCISFPNFCMFD